MAPAFLRRTLVDRIYIIGRWGGERPVLRLHPQADRRFRTGRKQPLARCAQLVDHNGHDFGERPMSTPPVTRTPPAVIGAVPRRWSSEAIAIVAVGVSILAALGVLLAPLGADVRDLRSEVSAVRADVAALSERVARLDERVARIEERISRVEERLARIGERVAHVEGLLSSAEPDPP